MLLLFLRHDAAAAYYDPLTGLRNRRGLAAAVSEHGDQPGTATVMVIDLDEFKRVNDRFGHVHGDVVLRAAASTISATFPSPAVTARTGGEEFVVLTHIDPTDAMTQANMLRDRFATQAGTGATVSVGVAHTDATTLTTSFEAAGGRADRAMYAAKRAGGNTVRVDATGVDMGC